MSQSTRGILIVGTHLSQHSVYAQHSMYAQHYVYAHVALTLIDYLAQDRRLYSRVLETDFLLLSAIL
jgi:hypothetical protein